MRKQEKEMKPSNSVDKGLNWRKNYKTGYRNMLKKNKQLKKYVESQGKNANHT